MHEYQNAGLRVGWLILPASSQVEIYTPSGIEVLNSPQTVSGGETLPGFKLELTSIWKPPF